MYWFDRAMMRLMQEWEIPGGALAVMQDGEILLARVCTPGLPAKLRNISFRPGARPAGTAWS